MRNQIQQTSQARKWGNSGGVLLPREWIGKQVKIILIDRTEEIKKEMEAAELQNQEKKRALS